MLSNSVVFFKKRFEKFANLGEISKIFKTVILKNTRIVAPALSI